MFWLSWASLSHFRQKWTTFWIIFRCTYQYASQWMNNFCFFCTLQMDRSCRFPLPKIDQTSVISLKTQCTACQRTEHGSFLIKLLNDSWTYSNGNTDSITNVSRCSHCNKFQVKCLKNMSKLRSDVLHRSLFHQTNNLLLLSWLNKRY
mgnify:CR=1 FL=1